LPQRKVRAENRGRVPEAQVAAQAEAPLHRVVRAKAKPMVRLQAQLVTRGVGRPVEQLLEREGAPETWNPEERAQHQAARTRIPAQARAANSLDKQRSMQAQRRQAQLVPAEPDLVVPVPVGEGPSVLFQVVHRPAARAPEALAARVLAEQSVRVARVAAGREARALLMAQAALVDRGELGAGEAVARVGPQKTRTS
jgi:hypothetical protein